MSGDRTVRPLPGAETDAAGVSGVAASGPLRLGAAGAVLTIQLARPERRNALDAEMVAALRSVLDSVEADAAVRVVAIRGVEPDFCAGADLRALAASQAEGPEAGLADAQRLGDLFLRIRRLPKPVVAVVTGRALAGGCALATACDLALARDDARFGYPEVRLGFVPAIAAALLRRKVGESAAFELTVRGRQVGAARAAALGLANEVFAADGFEVRVGDYLAELAARPPLATSVTKRLLYGLDGTALEDAVARGAEVNALARLTQECREGVAAFLRPEAEADG